MGPNAEFWERMAQGLPRFRFLRCSIPVQQIDQELTGSQLQAQWEQLKEQMQPGDQIWPFEHHVRPYLGMRRGYLVLRRGRPIGGIVTEVS